MVAAPLNGLIRSTRARTVAGAAIKLTAFALAAVQLFNWL
jgi:hypothetical protein